MFCFVVDSTTWVSYKNLDPTLRGHFIKKGWPRYLNISVPLTLKFFFLLDIVYTLFSLFSLLLYWCHLTFQLVLFLGLVCLPVMLFLTQLLENLLSKFAKWAKKILSRNLKDMSDDCMISEGLEWREVLSGDWELNSNVSMELEFEINMVVV